MFHFRRFLDTIILVTVSVCFGGGLVEGLSRMMYHKPWHQSLLEEQIAHQTNDSIKTNIFGLRDKEYSSNQDLSTRRILILGDSFTFGSGVADDDAVFPEILERQLNKEYSRQGVSIEILNGGIPGSLTDQWVELLLRLEKSFMPDTVLVVFFLRDGTRTAGSIGGFFNPIRNELKLKNQKSFYYQYSYLFRLYQDARDRDYLSAKYSKLMNDSYSGGIEQTQEWETAKNNMLRIKEICEQKRAVLGLVVFPVLVELNRNYPFQKPVDLIVQFGLASGISTHNLLPAFRGKNGPDLWVSSFDQHPNAGAHQITADSILPFLRQLLNHPIN